MCVLICIDHVQCVSPAYLAALACALITARDCQSPHPQECDLTVHCPARQLPRPKNEGALALPATRKDTCTENFVECRTTVSSARITLQRLQIDGTLAIGPTRPCRVEEGGRISWAHAAIETIMRGRIQSRSPQSEYKRPPRSCIRSLNKLLSNPEFNLGSLYSDKCYVLFPDS